MSNEKTKKMEEPKNEMLAKARALSQGITKKPGNEGIYVSDLSHWDTEAWETDSYSCNYLFGCGGIPRGKLIEIYGMQSSGKSTLSAYLASQVQKQGGVVFWLDFEQSFTPNHMKELGLNPDEVVLYTPDFAEQGLSIIKDIVTNGEIKNSIIVVDSVAAMSPEKVMKGEVEDAHMALLARLLSTHLASLAPFAFKNKITIIFINQVREKVGVMYGSNEITPGGNALKFYAATRIKAKKGDLFKVGDEVIGNVIQLTAVKNKAGNPFREVTIDLYYKSGIDYVSDVFDAALAKNIITRAGASYKHGDVSIAIGRDKCIATLRTDQELYQKISSQLKENKV